MMDKCDERVLRAVAFEAERTKVVERERDDLLARVERAEAERDALRKAGAALVAAVGTRECTLPEVVAMYAAIDAARKEEEG